MTDIVVSVGEGGDYSYQLEDSCSSPSGKRLKIEEFEPIQADLADLLDSLESLESGTYIVLIWFAKSFVSSEQTFHVFVSDELPTTNSPESGYLSISGSPGVPQGSLGPEIQQEPYFPNHLSEDIPDIPTGDSLVASWMEDGGLNPFGPDHGDVVAPHCSQESFTMLADFLSPANGSDWVMAPEQGFQPGVNPCDLDRSLLQTPVPMVSTTPEPFHPDDSPDNFMFPNSYLDGCVGTTSTQQPCQMQALFQSITLK